jgi:glycosyltransferase involved in cell wall biosynthesis
MKHVWIVNHYARDPSHGTSGSRHYSLSRALVRLGWTPTIFAARSEHNGLSTSASATRTRQRAVGGVAFRFLAVPPYVGNGPRRVFNMATFAVALLLPRATASLPRPDAIIGSTVHPLAAWSASCLARRYGVPFLFEIRDLWPQTLIDMGAIKTRGIVARLLRNLESLLCRRAARIITPLPFASEYLTSIGVPSTKVVWISNGTDVAEFGAPRPLPEGDFTFTYLGSMGTANGLDAVLNGFAKHAMDRSGTRLKLIGAGPEKARLIGAAAKLGLGERIAFQDPVPKVDVPAVAAASHCLVVNLLDLDVYRYGISLNKLFDYMAAGRPIIIATNSRNNPVRDAGGGISIRANNIDEIANAMSTMAKANLDDRSKWGANARRAVEQQYDYAKLAERLEVVLVEAIQSTRLSIGRLP